MERITAPPTEQRPIKALRDHLDDALLPAKAQLLRQVLAEKPTGELIDALFEIVYLPDLLDFFREDLERHHSRI